MIGCFSFLCIVRKCCFSLYAHIQRIHLQYCIPIFGQILLLNNIQQIHNLFFILNCEYTLELFIREQFETIQNLCFFQKGNSWNRCCFIKKPEIFRIQTVCFFRGDSTLYICSKSLCIWILYFVLLSNIICHFWNCQKRPYCFLQTMFCKGTSLFCLVRFSFKFRPFLLFFCKLGNMPKILRTPIFCFRLRKI